MHKYPFCFTFLVSRIFLLLIFFLFRALFTQVYYIDLVRNRRVSGHGHTYMLSFVQFVLNSVRCTTYIKKNNSLHICLLLSCKRKCLIFAWLCFFFLFFFLYKSLVLIYMNFFSIVKTIIEQQHLLVDKCRRM
jgi:hypothetical protein